ncbi:hypothetical protein ACTXN9_01745 [Corynebacterium casei]|uniref:hypothetical protein n=1 Tax=Corynebacterium casei TaxID=160386 RepID=UPI001868A2EE|nr:hypothetical protein [Corynebacterium casei]
METPGSVSPSVKKALPEPIGAPARGPSPQACSASPFRRAGQWRPLSPDVQSNDAPGNYSRHAVDEG